MNSSDSSLVSIGLPVRNGGDMLRKALQSLASQTHANFELLISDNDSQDETPAICEEWVRRDSRFRYIRQPRDIGPTANFLFVLEQAKAPYFMWAAHDDCWFPEFIAENLAVLQARQDVICSVSEVEFFDSNRGVVPFDSGTQPLMGDRQENLIAYLEEPAANSRIYGLYRTEVIQNCFDKADTYWAYDWAIVARSLMWGKHYQVPRCLMRRNVRGMSSDARKHIPSFNRTWFGRSFPMAPFTWTLLNDPTIPWSLALLRTLGRWNRQYWKDSVRRFRHGRIHPTLESLGLRRSVKRPDHERSSCPTRA